MSNTSQRGARTRARTPSVGFRQTVAREINELLDFRFKDIRASQGYRIVKIITTAMTKALLAGDSIRIEGFGIFRLRTRPAMKRGCRSFFYGKGRGPVLVRTVKPKTYVHFTPAKPLLALLNPKPDANQDTN